MMVRLGIDFENPAREWWASGGTELWESIAEAADASAIVVDESIAKSWLEQAATLPGWDEGPEYAPHPIRLLDLDPDEEV